nr:MAG TPA: hypothetical protein [Caudoviricetes sp.]DAR22297.1 MAG TPA: hypothetical protein [Caudoviricetes sp.]
MSRCAPSRIFSKSKGDCNTDLDGSRKTSASAPQLATNYFT